MDQISVLSLHAARSFLCKLCPASGQSLHALCSLIFTSANTTTDTLINVLLPIVKGHLAASVDRKLAPCTMLSSWETQASSTASTPPTYSLIRNVFMEPKHTFPSSISALSRHESWRVMSGIMKLQWRDFWATKTTRTAGLNFTYSLSTRSMHPFLQLWKSTEDLETPC